MSFKTLKLNAYFFIHYTNQKNFTQMKTFDNLNPYMTNEIKELLTLDVIPTTLDNIAIVLRYLNKQNWGTWHLPALSIPYSAHQYDCDGVVATTITLDRPVDGSKKFKIGGKRGHLMNFRMLR
jgi:hypothetical protein